MQLLVYILIYPILWIISILPFPVFYLLSDFVYFLTYNIIGYRKKVVRDNIKLALPHLSDKERLTIEKKFYSHMCDMFLEMIKTISISQKEIEKRFTFSNMDVYYDLEKKNKSIALMCAHYASYEWVVSMNYHINCKGFGIYKKLANPYFDKLVKRIRSKFKAELITTKQTIPTIAENHKNHVLGLYGLFAFRTMEIGRKAKLAGLEYAGNLAYGIGLLISLQTLVNISVNVGLLPTKGLTLPLMSAGGSSMIVACMAIGLLFRIDYETRINT